ncbi:DUF2269 family protein [Shimia sagamensis]|uniref:Uncharacterized membrane protein n=1 Tax=Shimia sagamensis TaxID=1566352 RepID=A0ABY1P0B6_9RHOB|nr:DUF2269 domain-containing protein [Shimia sagamensis]SMP22918.1 Uncharacterized membrane protein [Shimia sagamensis]
MIEDLLRFAHVLGATVLLGTGAGIAFFMVLSHRSRDPVLIAHVAGIVVIADTVFTATAALLQPITGTLLAWQLGWSLREPWLLLSLILYVVVGAFWLPVVWIQLQMRNLARTARDKQTPLPSRFFTLYRIWFACGFPAFFAVMGIVWLMLMKPVF